MTTVADSENRMDEFEATWSRPPGWTGWLAEVNNQPLGKRFMITSFTFFLVGGVLALLMRIQLIVPENTFLGPRVFNQMFTMHGSTMMYLFAVPFLEGLALYMLPLLIGSRDVAFPRLTAFSYWTFLFGGLVFYSSFLFGLAPEVGWFAYTPLSGGPGKGTDFWLLGLALVEIAGITAGVEIVVTIFKLRAPGMTLNRMPLFVWAMLVAGLMIIFAFTTLLTATLLLELDRAFGTRFFDPNGGGNSLLWQHLFWFFGHPEVYIAFLPATGVVSMIAPVFARRPVVGYLLIAVAIVVTGFVSFGLWVHHMYTTGLPEFAMNFFAAASLMIAIASGTQIFAWIATLWGSRPDYKTPLLFVLGFIFLFVLGGITGVMIAVVPFDWQVHDTYFLVAHFHYVLIGGVVFPIFAGLHYWLPKITGRMLSEPLGRASFWLTFIGFNVTFFPMHIMGLDGMPRRVYIFNEGLGLDGYNLIATVGAFTMGLGTLAFVVNFLSSLHVGEAAGKNPWNADTLEWSVESPPPIFAFYRPPQVRSLHPLWESSDVARSLRERDKDSEHDVARSLRERDKDSEHRVSEAAEQATEALAGEPAHWRATLCTDALHAQPQAVQYLPRKSHQPLFAALGVLVGSLGFLLEAYLLVAGGAIFTAGATVIWLWPRPRLIQMLQDSDIPERSGLPIFTTGSRSVDWWGLVGLLACLGTLFAVLFYSYFYLRLFSPVWPQDDLPRPDILLPLFAFLLVVAAGGAVCWASHHLQTEARRPVVLSLVGAFVLAGLFLLIQGLLLAKLEFTPTTNAYGSLFFVIHGAFSLLLVTAMALLATAATRFALLRDVRDTRLDLQMQITAHFWYFTAVIAVLVFAVVHLSPYLI